jgi:hypothetical protein
LLRQEDGDIPAAFPEWSRSFGTPRDSDVLKH